MTDLTSVKGSPSAQVVKFVECIFVAIAAWDFYNSMVLYPALAQYRDVRPIIRIFTVCNFVLTISAVLFAIIYPLYWSRKEKAAAIDSEKRHALFISILRYWLAVEICNYGFAKILGTQFAHEYTRDNSIAGNLSGTDLTWFYFGYSYTLSVIIALMQLGGSVLLLFRKTVFLGAALLLPVMVNIVLIDIFYHLPTGAKVNAILFTLGLIYLILLYRGELRVFLSRAKNTLPLIKSPSWLKYILRIGVIVYAFLMIYYFTTTESPRFLAGKWVVTQFIRNGNTINTNAWLTDSSAWTDIYLERLNKVTLSPNPYIIEAVRSRYGTYKYDETLHTIKLRLWTGDTHIDTLAFSLQIPDADHMQWKGGSDKESLQLTLTRSR